MKLSETTLILQGITLFFCAIWFAILHHKLGRLKKELIPEKILNDSQLESNEDFDKKMPGDEPRHFRKCRVCRKKHCICNLQEKGELR